MRKLALLSLLSNISLFATEQVDPEISMPWLLPWLIATLSLVAVFFWGIYKAMKTKNPKYGYVIFLSIFLIVGISFS